MEFSCSWTIKKVSRDLPAELRSKPRTRLAKRHSSSLQNVAEGFTSRLGRASREWLHLQPHSSRVAFSMNGFWQVCVYIIMLL